MMKKNLTALIAFIPVLVLAYMYNVTGFLLLGLIAFSLLILIGAGLLRLFRNKLNPRWTSVPLMVIAICLSGVIVGLFRPLEPAIKQSGSVSDKLAYAYQTDQSDRMTMKTYLTIFPGEKMSNRDSIRLQQVNQLYQKGQINKGRDKFYAAFIFHHSKKNQLYETAQKLANEAASVHELKDDYVVQWLAKASYDRWMVSLGKPQKYGTQDKFSVSVE